MTSSTLELQLAFLRERGASTQAHSFSNLLDHLLGTRKLLLSWQASPTVCTAGLFHSVYGTESFEPETVSLANRESVRDVIGKPAEEIAYLFSVMSQESFENNLRADPPYRLRERPSGNSVEIDSQMFRDLCNLSAANWLEQWDRLPVQLRSLGREKYYAMLKFLLPLAAKAIRTAHDFD